MSNSSTFIPVDFDPFAEENKFHSAPTTEPQREIFANIKLGGDAANLAYNESVTLKLTGDFRFQTFLNAVQFLVQRHEALRARFSEDGMLIHIDNRLNVDVPFMDISGLSEIKKENKLKSEQFDATNATFNLETGPLIRVSVVKAQNNIHYIILTLHHIVGDGWSLGMCMIDLGKIYSAFKKNLQPELEPPDSWIEYAMEEESFSASKESTDTENYWLKKYEGNIPSLELPINKPRPSLRTFKANRIDIPILSSTVEKLKSVGAKSGTSLVNIMTAAFEVYLHRITGSEDIVVGLPAAGQSAIGKYNLVGHCVQLLPLRTSINPLENFLEYVKRRKKTLLDDFEHQRFTFGSLIRKLNIPRDPSRIPLLPVSFNIDIGITNGVEFNGCELEFSTNPRMYENFEWFINCSGYGNNLTIECTYNSDLFEENLMLLRMQEFTQLLQSIVADIETPIFELDYLTNDEINLLNKWNETERNFSFDKGVHQLFEKMAETFGGNTAIEFQHSTISYSELNQKANFVANYLIEKGIKQNEPVCVCIERSIEMVVAMLGILKSGGCYIPVDPDFPADRIEYMLNNSSTRFLISNSKIKDKLANSNAECILLDNGWEKNYSKKIENPQTEFDASQLAYIIYTSGSTGKPKGVQIQHRAFVNLLLSFKEDLAFTEKEILLAITTVSFDIAGLEIFLPLITGSKLIIASKEETLDASKLLEYFNTKKITVFQATPATYKILEATGWQPSDKIKLLIGGEAVPLQLAKHFSQFSDNILNVYGPTETTIWSTSFAVKNLKSNENATANSTLQIGKPIANTLVYVLDEFLKQRPVGIEGEIYIGGEGLSSGYFNQQELTDDRFIYTTIFNDGIIRLYNTGDKGKILPDGNIEYTGRSDFQVKIRGYRIELGEIEAVIRQLLTIKDVVVHVKEDKQGDKKIVAYMVVETKEENFISSLKSLLSEKLPAYMMPSAFMLMDKLPTTPNGKIDRKALPDPEINVQEQPTDTNEILLQISSTEETLVDIWKEILHLNRVGIKDNFFELGGHSLIGVKMFIEIEKRLGVKLNLQSLFKAPTISELAKIIDKEESSIQWQPLITLQPNGSRTPLFCVHMHNGNIYRWKVLQNFLPPDQPIYAIQPRALDEKQQPHRNIEEMAKSYIEIIRKVQPHGPYNLLGLCFGGMVVFEMALQLQALNEKVAFAGMVNTYAPLENHGYYRLRKELENFMKLGIGEKINYAIQKNLNLGRKLKNKALNIFGKSVQEKTESETMQEDIRFIHTLALIHYNPKKQYNGNIYIVRTGGPIEDSEFYDATLGWKRLVNGDIEIKQVEYSTNDSIIEDNQYNSQLSLFIKNKLDEVWNYKEEIA